MNRLQGKRRRRTDDAGGLPRTAPDMLAAAILFFAPLAMAGRHPWGRALYVGLVGCLAVSWLYSSMRDQKTLRRSGLEMISLLGLLVVVAQCVPLPTGWRQSLSPHIEQLLPAWNGPDSLIGSTWRTLSLTPHATREGGWILLAHLVWLTFWVQRLEHESDVRRALRWTALSGCWIALVGMLQYLFGNGKFLWVYENPFRDATGVLRGPFYNENHCAHYMALAWPCLWWWMGRVPKGNATFTVQGASSSTQALRWGLGLGLIGLLFAGALTRSRGGILALLLSVMASVLLSRWGSEGRDRWWPRLLCVGAVVLAALMIHGLGEVTTEVATLTSTSLDEIDQHGARRALWLAAWQIARAFPVFGTGIGSFREAFPLHYDPPQHVDYSYAESGFLHVLAETGGLGFLLLLGGCTLVLVRWRRAWFQSLISRGLRPELAACGAALLVSGFHSLFDFVWFIPACLSMTFVLVACVWRISQMTAEPERRSDLPYGDVVVAPWAWQGALIVVVVSVTQLLPSARASLPWEAYLRTVNDEELDANGRDSSQLNLDTVVVLRHLLEETVRLDPHHARARVRLAGLCLREFEMRQAQSDNPMALSQIREAALASAFPTRDAQDTWIDRVVGNRRLFLTQAVRHARNSLRLSPLQGDAYLYLSELSFLVDPRPEQQERWVEQALCARPHSGALRFAAGQQAILKGDVARGLEQWKRAYQMDPLLRPQIARQLVGRVPVQVFLDQFEPRPADMVALHEYCQSLGAHSDAALIATRYVDCIVNPSAPSTHSEEWQQAYTYATQIGDPRSRDCALQAVQIDPENYTMRRRLAMEFFAAGAFSDAVDQLEWCLRQTPRDRGLQGKLAMAREQLTTR